MYNFKESEFYDVSTIELNLNSLTNFLKILKENHYTYMVEDYLDESDMVRVCFMYSFEDERANITDVMEEQICDDCYKDIEADRNED